MHPVQPTAPEADHFVPDQRFPLLKTHETTQGNSMMTSINTNKQRAHRLYCKEAL